MAVSRYLLRSPTMPAQSSGTTLKSLLAQTLRSLSTSSTAASHRNNHQSSHEFLPPSEFLNSWKPPKDPKEAEAKLSQLRREYAKKVKEIRKVYSFEMELQRQEKQRKDEARREAIRIANEERKAAKSAQKKAKAAEREVALEEFRQTLLKERQEKLEYWKMKEQQMKEKTKEKNELLRRQSSMWIDESELEKKILEAIVDTFPL